MPPDTSLTIDRAGFERGGRDRGLRGVDAHRRPPVRGELAHDRLGAAQLLGGVDRRGAGPGRLAADVEHRGARGRPTRSPWAIADAASEKRPPSEKESGVTLTTPMSARRGSSATVRRVTAAD